MKGPIGGGLMMPPANRILHPEAWWSTNYSCWEYVLAAYSDSWLDGMPCIGCLPVLVSFSHSTTDFYFYFCMSQRSMNALIYLFLVDRQGCSDPDSFPCIKLSTMPSAAWGMSLGALRFCHQELSSPLKIIESSAPSA